MARRKAQPNDDAKVVRPLDRQPQAGAIREQLDRILASPDFKASDRLKRFLRFIVEETLAGRAASLKGYTIATMVFGKDASFDPQIDPIVRIEAGKLRQRLSQYYYVRERKDPLRIEIPTGSYVPEFYPVVPESAQPSPVDTLTARLQASEPPTILDIPSIAVLPFLNLSNDNSQNYFAEGLAEELTVALTRFQDLKVINSYSTYRFKTSTADLCEIARQLGVRFILKGSVRKSTPLIRITAQLVDAVSGSNLWAETFEPQPTVADLFAVQDEITQQVVARIADSFGFINRTLVKECSSKRPDDLKAYDAVLLYHNCVAALTPKRISLAIQALEHAVQIDPDYPVTTAMLADLYATDYQFGYDQVDQPLEKSMDLARRAISLDPACQTGRWAMALNYFLGGEKENFLSEIEQVISLNPNYCQIIGASALLLTMIGDVDRGLALINKVTRLNPFFPGWHCVIPYIIHYQKQEYEAALREALRINIPEFFWDPLLQAAVYGKLGQKADAQTSLQELLRLRPLFTTRWRQLMQAYVFSEENVAILMEGLRDAGLAG
ncbi:MAG: hypothetical protein JSW39_28920 [Desulfobacterales bacterium]|nr:MAG: hypothetical protein JSW39_28920 [Desulfobacterales bacterium]